MTITVQEVAYHRNGVRGIGFFAVRFRWAPDDGKLEDFLAIVFDAPGECAVIGIDRLPTMGVAFARGNSWRGDTLEGELRSAIASARDSSPFPPPTCSPM